MDLLLKVVGDYNIDVLLNLSQAYEAEFSSITGKRPNEDGVFTLDTMPYDPYIGYILYCACCKIAKYWHEVCARYFWKTSRLVASTSN